MELIREKLLFYALKYKGDWDSMITAINRKEEIDIEFLNKEKNKLKCNYITLVDKDYPAQFKEVYKPPLVLFYYGDISLIRSNYLLGVVGSRNPTSYGIKACEELLNGLKDVSVTIVSGMAKGIDEMAHKTAFDNNLKTIAILGVGIDYCYPKENYYLYKKLKKDGLIISEYPYKEVVSKNSFALRNRLIASLSNGILIPDVKKNSGTSLTVRFALNYGKDIMVVPCSIFEDLINNQLIFDGAIPITSAKDLKTQIK